MYQKAQVDLTMVIVAIACQRRSLAILYHEASPVKVVLLRLRQGINTGHHRGDDCSSDKGDLQAERIFFTMPRACTKFGQTTGCGQILGFFLQLTILPVLASRPVRLL